MNAQQFNPVSWIVSLFNWILITPIKQTFLPPVPPEPTILHRLEMDISSERLNRLTTISRIESAKLKVAQEEAILQMHEDRIVRLGKDLKTEAAAMSRTRTVVEQALAADADSKVTDLNAVR